MKCGRNGIHCRSVLHSKEGEITKRSLLTFVGIVGKGRQLSLPSIQTENC